MVVNVDNVFSFYQALRGEIKAGHIDEVTERVQELEQQLEEHACSATEAFYVRSILGKYYRKVKNYDKAGTYFREAIRFSKHVEQEHVEEVIDTYLDYAHLEIEYGQESNGRIELAKLLAMLDTNHYPDMYTYGVIFRDLAKISFKEGDIENSVKQYEKALSYYKEALPETHPVMIAAIYELSDVLVQIENYNDAVNLHQQLGNAYKKEKDKLSEARELLKIGEIHFYIDLKEARKIITKAIKEITDCQKHFH
ncbi:tetratricopeptide repeat protein [Oceanobacillus timonensis]|uniref:tetratricopeptide repeat protein n=1 Tax=Oceanobacillus timonensis TaxID=1926285 RepID=UPI0009BA2A26|nr:tetratricopeptide repeat protein [Oceanobacillus timonensis]